MRALRAPRPGRAPRRAAPWLAAAACLAALAVALTARAASGDGPSDLVLVARQAIPLGTDLGGTEAEAYLAAVAVPRGLPLAGLVRDRAALEGRRVAVPIAPGEPITQAAVGGGPQSGAPAPLAPGERAISVPTALAGAAAGALIPGVRVDVLASAGEGRAGESRVVVAGAEVLAASAPADAVRVAAEPSALLRVTARQALHLAQALNFAQDVRVVIRPFGEALP